MRFMIASTAQDGAEEIHCTCRLLRNLPVPLGRLAAQPPAFCRVSRPQRTGKVRSSTLALQLHPEAFAEQPDS